MLIRVFSNTVNPYNSGLFACMRAQGVDVQVSYRSNPTASGRRWRLTLHGWEEELSGLRNNLLSGIRARGADVVVLTGGYRHPEELAHHATLLRTSGRVVYWGERLRDTHKLGDVARRALFRRLDAVFAIGTWAVPGYTRYLTGPTPVHVFPYTTTAQRAVRPAVSGTPTVGFVGSLTHRKGIDVILHALGRLPLNARPAFEVVGSGPGLGDLSRLADRVGVTVKWLGELHQAEIDQQRLSWWVQVVPSRYDGWGVVVAEALASGVPVIASNTTGAGIDLVRNGRNGMVLEQDDDWAEAIASYCDADRVATEGAVARRIGRAMSSEEAAPWFLRHLQGRTSSENFVDFAWNRALSAHD